MAQKKVVSKNTKTTTSKSTTTKRAPRAKKAENVPTQTEEVTNSSPTTTTNTTTSPPTPTAPVETTTTTTTATTPASTQSNTVENIANLRDEMTSTVSWLENTARDLKQRASTIRRMIRVYDTTVRDLQKTAQSRRKTTQRVKRPRDPNSYNAFLDPNTILSDAFCDFLGMPHGSTMSRVESANHVRNYIKTNNLVDENRKFVYKPDNKLTALFGEARFPIRRNSKNADLALLENGYSVYNLQTYLAPHYVSRKVEAK